MKRPSRVFGWIAACAACLFGSPGGLGDVRAQFAPAGTMLTRSRSGQFIISAQRGAQTGAAPSNLETNRGFFRLDPSLVPVSCEHIKAGLKSYLGAPPDWTGRIYVNLYPATTADDPIRLVCDQFRDGWGYRLALPNVIERTRYVNAVVQVLLQELANRGAKGRTAEIPNWLTEGISAHLLGSSATQIILNPPNAPANGILFTSTEAVGQMRNPLERAHQVLSASHALSFQQLSWPTDEQLAGHAREVYRFSAQLFVSELLNLKDGQACLRKLLAELPKHYNWQFAFLEAFHPYFQRPLEVEKWWALQVLHFTGHGLTQSWPAEESWHKLDEIIHSPVAVRIGTNDLPLRTEASLQSMIREWNREALFDTLSEKLRELDQLRLRVSPSVVALVDGYRQALAMYLQTSPGKKPNADSPNAATLKLLDQLDALRFDMRPAQKSGLAAGESEAATPHP